MRLSKIREALVDRNLAHVSRAIGVARPTLSLIRSGKLTPSDAALAKLSAYLEKRP